MNSSLNLKLKFLFVIFAMASGISSFRLNAMEFNNELPSDEQKVSSPAIEEQEPFEWPPHLSNRWRRLPEGAMQQVFTNLFKSLPNEKEKHLFALHSIKESIKHQHPFNEEAVSYVAKQLKQIIDKNPRLILDKGIDGLVNSVIPQSVQIPSNYFNDKNKAVISQFADNQEQSLVSRLKNKKGKVVNQNDDLRNALHKSFVAEMKKQTYPNAPYYECSRPNAQWHSADYTKLFQAQIEPLWIGILNDVCTIAFADDHTIVAGTNTGAIYTIDFEKKINNKQTIANTNALAAILNNMGTLFASAYNDGTVTLFDLKTNKQINLKASKGCTILAFSRDSNYLLGASNTILYVWDLKTKKLINEYDLKNNIADIYVDEPVTFNAVNQIVLDESSSELLISIKKQKANGDSVITVLEYYFSPHHILFAQEKEPEHRLPNLIDAFDIPSLSKAMLQNEKWNVVGSGVVSLTWDRRVLDLCDFDSTNNTHEKRFRVRFECPTRFQTYAINGSATKLVALADTGKLFMWEIPQFFVKNSTNLNNELSFYALWKFFDATAQAKKSLHFNDEALYPSYAFSKNDQVKLRNLLKIDILPENEKELIQKLLSTLRIQSKNTVMLSNVIHELRNSIKGPPRWLERSVPIFVALEILLVTYLAIKKGPHFMVESAHELLSKATDDLLKMKNLALGLILGGGLSAI